MKSKYLLLLKMQSYNFLGINRMIHSHNRKEKQRSIAMGVLAVLVLGMLITYSAIFSASLAGIGAENILPTLSMLVCSLIVLMLTFLKSSGVLIGLRDYDMVMSLPVKNFDMVLSRLTIVYLANLFISMIVILPAVIVFAMNTKSGASGTVMFLLSLPFVPIIPMIVSLGMGILIMAVSSKTKYKNILSLVLSIFVILLIVVFSTQVQNMDLTEILNVGIALSSAAERVYPLAAFISTAIQYENWQFFLMFVGISVLIGGVFTGIAAYFYQTINTVIFSHSTVQYTEKPLKVSSPFKAMYKREFGRYFSCTIYALNSTIGMVLLFVISVLLFFISPERLEQQSGMAGFSKIMRQLLPLMVALFISITSTTAASLSLEGKNRWLMCSVPVRAMDIFHSKIAVNLTVIFPFALISVLLLGIKMKVSLIQAVLLCIVPTVYACFISVLGMYMNVKFPKYDWTSEYYAVKGGAVSVLATMGIGILSSAIPFFLCLFFTDFSTIIMVVTSCLLFTITANIYKLLKGIPLYM